MISQRSFSVLRVLRQHKPQIPRAVASSFSTSSSPGDPAPVQVEVSPDGKTIFCWHPEPEFPYEHTKPLPRKEEIIKQGDSILKVQYLKEEIEKYRPEGPTYKELTEMFTVDRPFFRDRPRRRYAKANPPVDRKSI